MSANPKVVTTQSASPSEGMTHEELLAVNDLVALPAIPESNKPLPIIFEQAVRAVAACRTIDEATYWDNKSDALAAWAKIYADDRVMREARALKLHAYRRIGQIADSARKWEPLRNGRGGTTKGPHSLLMEHGFSRSRSTEMLRLARAPDDRFTAIVNAKRPPSPSMAVGVHLRPNPLWADFYHAMNIFASKIRKTSAKNLVETLNEKQIATAATVCNELMEWLREFERQCGL